MCLHGGTSTGVIPKQQEQEVNHCISLLDCFQQFQALDDCCVQYFRMTGKLSEKKAASFPSRFGSLTS